MKAQVIVTLKPSVLDPQGAAIGGALHAMGYGKVNSVRQGKIFDVELETSDRAEAEKILKDAGEKLLANTVIEKFDVKVL